MLKVKYLHRKSRKNRHKSWNSKSYKRPGNLDLFSDLPFRQRIGKQYGNYIDYDSRPLTEFIESKIGEDWNDVYSEILTKIKKSYRYSIEILLRRWYYITYDEDFIPICNYYRFVNDRIFVDLNNVLVKKTKEEILMDAERYKKQKLRREKLEKIIENLKNENTEFNDGVCES